jgi:thiamine kinase-like enzyme
MILDHKLWVKTKTSLMSEIEAIMLCKLFMTDEMLPEVQTGKTLTKIWKHLKELHETLDKEKAFFLKNMLFFITMDESASLQEYLLKIKDIREQLSHWLEDGRGGTWW